MYLYHISARPVLYCDHFRSVDIIAPSRAYILAHMVTMDERFKVFTDGGMEVWFAPYQEPLCWSNCGEIEAPRPAIVNSTAYGIDY